MTYTTARLIAAAMLLAALGDLPYGYYTLLRFIVCGVAGYGAFLAYEKNERGWLAVLGGMALLFNPLIPFYMSRGIWGMVDFGAAAILVGSVISQTMSKGEARITQERES